MNIWKSLTRRFYEYHKTPDFFSNLLLSDIVISVSLLPIFKLLSSYTQKLCLGFRVTKVFCLET